MFRLKSLTEIRLFVELVYEDCLKVILLDSVAYEDMNEKDVQLFCLESTVNWFVGILARIPVLVLQLNDVLILNIVLLLEEGADFFTFLQGIW